MLEMGNETPVELAEKKINACVMAVEVSSQAREFEEKKCECARYNPP